MPKTFKASITLIVTLNVLIVLTMFNIWQTNNAEKSVLELRQRVDALSQGGMPAAPHAGAGSGSSAEAKPAANASQAKYEAALSEPGNLLVKATDELIFPGAKRGGTLRRILGDDPKGYNWVTENSVDVSEIQTYVHSAFSRQDFNNPDNYAPDLAWKVTVNADNTEYTVHLKEGVYWQVPNVDFSKPGFAWLKEPRELTAEDAVFLFELVQNPQVEAGAIKSYYQDLAGAEVVDKYTFKVRWAKPVAHSREFTIGMYPMPKWLFTKDEEGNPIPEETLGLSFNNHWAAAHPIGTGPYRFVKHEAGQRVVLERSPGYHGEAPQIERIEYQIVRDPETSYVKLQAKEVDFLGNVPAPKYKSDILDGGPTSPFKNGSLNHGKIDVFAYYYIGWNADKPLFKDKKVRLAMSHALNREGIIQNVLHGLGSLQTGPYYYKHPALDPNIGPIPFDLEKAKQLLDEAGWVDTNKDGIRDKTLNGQRVDFKFNITSYNRPEVRSWLTVFREDLRKIGVEMKIDPVDWPLMQRRMDEKQFDAFTGGWGLSWFIDPFQLWHSSQADVPKGSNRVGFRSPEGDKIIEELRTTFDADARIALLRKLHAIIHDEQPYTFFYAPQSVPAWQPQVKHVVFQKIRPQSYSLPWYME